MALKTYTIEGFVGIDQSVCENLLSSKYSPDAINMDASRGELAVARGYQRHIPTPIPGAQSIDRLLLLRTAGGDIPVVITGNTIYSYDAESAEWTSRYTYAGAPSAAGYFAVTTRIGMTDYLIIADGAHTPVKFDGTEVTDFGSEEGCSNIAINYPAMYRGRLFAAGDAQNPNRLYYSQLPGGDRTIESWGYVEASPAVEGGHVEIGETGGDPITAVAAMSNQLLIFKKRSLYRLIGDRPSNFTIERIEAQTRATPQSSVVIYGDVIYFVNSDGLHYYNGVDAAPMPDMRRVSLIMASADASRSVSAVVGDSLYFSVLIGGEAHLVEYDLAERRYMLRGGFEVSDILSDGDNLLLVNSARYVYLFNSGDTYDGVPIAAHWRTPLTDMGDKSAVKALRELYLRGTALTRDCAVLADISIGECADTYRRLLPFTTSEVLEIPLKNEGRTLCVKLYNEAGGRFSLTGGAELALSLRGRTE